MITTDNCKDIVDLLKRDAYISGIIEIEINSKMPVSTLYALEQSSISMRPNLTDVANKAASIESLSLPEKRVNHIAAEIYEKIDFLTGKHVDAGLSWHSAKNRKYYFSSKVWL